MPRWLPRVVSIALIPALAAQQTQPVFRAGVQLIEVDVQVTDQNGNTVRGLTRGDFTILEDDMPQEIAELTFVDRPIEPRTERRADIDEVRVMAALETSAGRQLRSVPAVPIATEAARIAVTTRISLSDVRPGNYVLTIEARTTRHTVNRKVPFSVE